MWWHLSDFVLFLKTITYWLLLLTSCLRQIEASSPRRNLRVVLLPQSSNAWELWLWPPKRTKFLNTQSRHLRTKDNSSLKGFWSGQNGVDLFLPAHPYKVQLQALEIAQETAKGYSARWWEEGLVAWEKQHSGRVSCRPIQQKKITKTWCFPDTNVAIDVCLCQLIYLHDWRRVPVKTSFWNQPSIISRRNRARDNC